MSMTLSIMLFCDRETVMDISLWPQYGFNVNGWI